MNTYLRATLSALALAAIVAVPAVAKSRSQHTSPGSTDVYQSYSLGHQSYPNPDRGPYPTPVPAWVDG
jgi:hypothetical protein